MERERDESRPSAVFTLMGLQDGQLGPSHQDVSQHQTVLPSPACLPMPTHTSKHIHTHPNTHSRLNALRYADAQKMHFHAVGHELKQTMGKQAAPAGTRALIRTGSAPGWGSAGVHTASGPTRANTSIWNDC